MYLKFKDGKSKVLTLSYDDGVVQDIRLIEIMNKYGLKGTFNINSGLYLPEDKERERFYGRLKLSEAKALYPKHGQEIALHAYSHPFLEKLHTQEMICEIIDDRQSIEKEYGIVTRGMAYPFGTYSNKVIDVLKLCGIAYSRTTKSTEKFELPQNWLEWHPTCHHNCAKLDELTDKFTKTQLPSNRLWLFYLWGHSYEFDNDNNWERIEEFAKKIGGRDDIWYATNIEIYDYIKAYEKLRMSVDKKIIHNPTATDVWVYDGGETFVIKGGETLYR